MLVEKTDLHQVLELLRYCDRPQDASFLENWAVPVMPVNGKDLIGADVERGTKFGIILRSMKQRWMESGYSLSKEELIELTRREGIKETQTESKKIRLDE